MNKKHNNKRSSFQLAWVELFSEFREVATVNSYLENCNQYVQII